MNNDLNDCNHYYFLNLKPIFKFRTRKDKQQTRNTKPRQKRI